MKKQILFAAIALSAFTLTANAQEKKEVKTKTTTVANKDVKTTKMAKPATADAKPVVKEKVKTTKTTETTKTVK